MKRSSLLTRLQFSYTYALLLQWFRPSSPRAVAQARVAASAQGTARVAQRA